ncbi:hypothetical protein FKM82_009427 [Ascaphus truei]
MGWRTSCGTACPKVYKTASHHPRSLSVVVLCFVFLCGSMCSQVIPEVQFAIWARMGRTGPRDTLRSLQGKRLQDFLKRNMF